MQSANVTSGTTSKSKPLQRSRSGELKSNSHDQHIRIISVKVDNKQKRTMEEETTTNRPNSRQHPHGVTTKRLHRRKSDHDDVLMQLKKDISTERSFNTQPTSRAKSSEQVNHSIKESHSSLSGLPPTQIHKADSVRTKHPMYEEHKNQNNTLVRSVSTKHSNTTDSNRTRNFSGLQRQLSDNAYDRIDTDHWLPPVEYDRDFVLSPKARSVKSLSGSDTWFNKDQSVFRSHTAMSSIFPEDFNAKNRKREGTSRKKWKRLCGFAPYWYICICCLCVGLLAAAIIVPLVILTRTTSTTVTKTTATTATTTTATTSTSTTSTSSTSTSTSSTTSTTTTTTSTTTSTSTSTTTSTTTSTSTSTTTTSTTTSTSTSTTSTTTTSTTTSTSTSTTSTTTTSTTTSTSTSTTSTTSTSTTTTSVTTTSTTSTTTTTTAPPNCTTCMVSFSTSSGSTITNCDGYCDYVNNCCDYGNGTGVNSGGGAGRNYTGSCGGTCYTGYGGRTGFGLTPCCNDGTTDTGCLNATSLCNTTGCCNSGCCNGVCCSSNGSCCNNLCCNGPCCNDTCCTGYRTCCNGACCNGNCCNGVCCDGACCGSGSSMVCCPGVFCCSGSVCCTTGICCNGNCCRAQSNTTCTVYGGSTPSCFSRRQCRSPFNHAFCCCD